MYRSFLVLVSFFVMSLSTDVLSSNGDILLPIVPVTEEPPTPQPPTPPIRYVSELTPDNWYVVESTKPLIVLSSPEGLVSVVPEKGPIRVRGKFADGDGETETRTYSAEHIYFIEAVKPGETELIFIPEGVVDAEQIVRQKLVISGLGPNPPPIPPDPEPDPDPPTPNPPSGIRVLLLVNEDATREQLNTINSLSVISWMDENTVKSDDGRPEWRRWDRTSIDKPGMLDTEDPLWRKLWTDIKPHMPDGILTIVVADDIVKYQPMAGPQETLDFFNRIKAGE
jgi:hypothetical protein